MTDRRDDPEQEQITPAQTWQPNCNRTLSQGLRPVSTNEMRRWANTPLRGMQCPTTRGAPGLHSKGAVLG